MMTVAFSTRERFASRADSIYRSIDDLRANFGLKGMMYMISNDSSAMVRLSLDVVSLEYLLEAGFTWTMLHGIHRDLLFELSDFSILQWSKEDLLEFFN